MPYFLELNILQIVGNSLPVKESQPLQLRQLQYVIVELQIQDQNIEHWDQLVVCHNHWRGLQETNTKNKWLGYYVIY